MVFVPTQTISPNNRWKTGLHLQHQQTMPGMEQTRMCIISPKIKPQCLEINLRNTYRWGFNQKNHTEEYLAENLAV